MSIKYPGGMKKMLGIRHRYHGLFLLAGVCFLAVLLLSGVGLRPAEEKVEDNNQRVTYLRSLGWAVDPAPLSAQYTTLPEEFPDVLLDYNELQQRQGFDLRPYAGKDVTIYIYRVLTDSMEETVYCTLYVHRGKVIGGDVHTASLNGFMSGLVREDGGTEKNG